MIRKPMMPILALLLVEPGSAQVTSYEAEGNLQAVDPLECVPLEEVSTSSTAMDVATGAKECASDREYEQAAELFMVASALAYFDTRRVADESAHAALSMLPLVTFGELSERRLNQVFENQVFEAVDALYPESPRAQAICEHLRQQPPPTYMPTYMIAHGMGSFLEEDSEPLVEDFDAQAAWIEAMEYILCES